MKETLNQCLENRVDLINKLEELKELFVPEVVK
jgi:hypothetical protein